MPHLHLETTADLPENAHVPDILAALGEALSREEDIAAQAVKAYHTLRSNWFVGEGHAPGFAHVTVKILEGRSVERRSEIADRLTEVLRAQFAESLAADEVRVTLEIVEMPTETYRRI